MIKAVVFDFDGLIIDTESPWYDAYRAAFQDYGVDLPLELWLKCVGTTFAAFDPIVYLEEQSGGTIDRNEIFAKTRKRHDQIMQEKGLREGVQSYLEDAAAKGLRIGLATSSSRAWIDRFLKRFDLTHYFDQINTADDVEKVKPDPELYVKTIRDLGVEANEAIAFEDSLNGLTAAKAAGLQCVIVPNDITRHLPFADYDLKLASMGDMTLEEVIWKIEKSMA